MKGFNYDSLLIQENLERVAEMSTLSLFQESKDWYWKAHEKAQEYTKEFKKDICITSGLISVMSPQKEWSHNLRLTEEYLKSGAKTCKHTRVQREKAKYIYYTDGYPRDFIPYIEAILGGPKTINFFRNILNPDDKEFCTIDGHMAALMTGNLSKEKLTPKQYLFLKDEMIKFANKEGKIPSQLQAELWLIYKENKWNK